MKAEVKRNTGLITALSLTIILIGYRYSRNLGSTFDTLFLMGYLFALISKNLIFAKTMFTFFIFSNLTIFNSMPSQIAEDPPKYIFVWAFTIIVLGFCIFLLGVGIAGLRQILEEENKQEKLLPK